jgi:hypothetical protein
MRERWQKSARRRATSASDIRSAWGSSSSQSLSLTMLSQVLFAHSSRKPSPISV